LTLGLLLGCGIRDHACHGIVSTATGAVLGRRMRAWSGLVSAQLGLPQTSHSADSRHLGLPPTSHRTGSTLALLRMRNVYGWQQRCELQAYVDGHWRTHVVGQAAVLQVHQVVAVIDCLYVAVLLVGLAILAYDYSCGGSCCSAPGENPFRASEVGCSWPV
jgi:hypothetical protein